MAVLRTEPDAVCRVACVGAGVIGGGWAAHFLARGMQVAAWDPAAGAEAALRRLIGQAWPALQTLGLAKGATLDNLTFAAGLADAVADAEFIQESVPERLELKRAVLAEIDAAAAPGTIVASSTSGYPMTEMATACARPERLVVGHPFNPPYLIPLVEVVGGARTDPAAVDWAARFYQSAGKTVIKMDRELPGFIANRLQEALWREALHMIAKGEATVAEIDDAIAQGPGLRWPAMGPCLTFHLAGGEGGMAHMLDQFGPFLAGSWSRLAAPALTEQLRDRLVQGCREIAAGRTIGELVGARDRRLVAILQALRGVP